jgi:hypothetical protein
MRGGKKPLVMLRSSSTDEVFGKSSAPNSAFSTPITEVSERRPPAIKAPSLSWPVKLTLIGGWVLFAGATPVGFLKLLVPNLFWLSIVNYNHSMKKFYQNYLYILILRHW